ncbi:MAG: hypothetical protein IK016_09205 [Lachnospiraceae bacterium]|nr:hypothetical protein [Lachnospiraceae bacterium]
MAGKRTISKMAVGMMLAVFLMSCASGGGDVSEKGAKKGDIIAFGSYEQDGNTANGKEPIEWEVLAVEGDGILVVSRYVLDCVPYHEEYEGVTWETCTLRKWMNNDFYNAAFSPEERGQILESHIENPDNACYGTSGGNATKDRVFCLSVDEIREHYRFNVWYEDNQWGLSEQLLTEPTAYARDKNVWIYTPNEEDYQSLLNRYEDEKDREAWESPYTRDVIGKEGCVWWLRSPGNRENNACDVDYGGRAGWDDNALVDVGDVGVRPALRLSR